MNPNIQERVFKALLDHIDALNYELTSKTNALHSFIEDVKKLEKENEDLKEKLLGIETNATFEEQGE